MKYLQLTVSKVDPIEQWAGSLFTITTAERVSRTQDEQDNYEHERSAVSVRLRNNT